MTNSLSCLSGSGVSGACVSWSSGSGRRDGRGRLYGNGFSQQRGDQILVQAELGEDLDRVLSERRWRQIQAHLEVSQAPEGADLLQLAPFGVWVGGHQAEL